MTAGLMTVCQGDLGADQKVDPKTTTKVQAKQGCKAVGGGCANLVSLREMKTMQEMQNTKEYVDDVEETNDGTEGNQDF